MNSMSNLQSVDMLNSSQASIAGMSSFGGLSGGGGGGLGSGLSSQLRSGGRLSAGSGGSSMSGRLRLSQLGTTTDSLSQQQQQQAAAMRYPLSFQNPLFHLATDDGPQQQQLHHQHSRAQPPAPLLLAPDHQPSHQAYTPQFAHGGFSRSEDLSTLRTRDGHLGQPSIIHSHSYSDDYSRVDYGRRQMSMQVQVRGHHPVIIPVSQAVFCNARCLCLFSEGQPSTTANDEHDLPDRNLPVLPCRHAPLHRPTYASKLCCPTFLPPR